MLGFFFEFAERITESYPEIYNGGGSEAGTSGYFEKWGWYSTIDALAKGKIWKYDYVFNLNIHEMHVFLAHKIDKDKLKARLRAKK